MNLPSFPHTVERIEYNDKFYNVRVNIYPSVPAQVELIKVQSSLTGDEVKVNEDDKENLLENVCVRLKKEIGSVFVVKRKDEL